MGSSLTRPLIFAVVVDIIHGIMILEHWSTRLPDPRITDTDIVVVTGGSSGLGKYLCAILATKPYHQIINLDITEVGHFNSPSIAFMKCDVSDYDQVQDAYKRIKQLYGIPTVLINNAGIVYKGSYLDMNIDSIRNILSVNTLGVFWTIKTFVPDMIKQNRGHIVTVSSVLGKIGPAGVACYSASKAALITFHDSFTHEIADHKGVGTLLVTPGQMDGPMFKDVTTPSSLLAPVVNSRDVAIAIVDALEAGTTGQLSMPLYARLIGLTQVLPRTVVEIVRAIYGMDKCIRRSKYGTKDR